MSQSDLLTSLDSALNNAFEASLHDVEDLLAQPIEPSPWRPQVDVSDTGSTYEIHADAPGVHADDLRVSVENGRITISGERHEEQRQEQAHWFRLERLHGSFSRSFRLPEDADATALRSQASEGHLTVSLPKRNETTPTPTAVPS